MTTEEPRGARTHAIPLPQARQIPECCGHLGCSGELNDPCNYVIAAMITDSPRCNCTGTRKPFRDTFDPKCTEWVAFRDLKAGDVIDYWGAGREITDLHVFEDDRIRIITPNGVGRDLAVAPRSECTYRVPREGNR